MSPITETFTGLNVENNEQTSLTFSEACYFEVGVYDVEVEILKVNGEDDGEASNNIKKKEGIEVAMSGVERSVTIDYFTSSTCTSCVGADENLTNLLALYPGKFNISKYQMNWPNPVEFPNGDPYYTEEGGMRRIYYGVTGTPKGFFDGEQASLYDYIEKDFLTASSHLAFLDINGGFIVSGKEIEVDVELTSYTEIPDGILYVVVNEKRTTGNVANNGETEFFHVMMKMLPGADGTSVKMNAGETLSFNFKQDLTDTFVEEFDDLEVNVFVQDYESKKVYNGALITGEKELPKAPTNLLLENVGNNAFRATWSAAKEEPTGYHIYLNNEMLEENFSGAEYTVTASDPERLQIFGIRAVYAGGETSIMVTKSIMICNSEAPANLKAVSGVTPDVTLTWDAPSTTPDKYIVYQDGAVVDDNVTTTTYTIGGLADGVYTFGVSAIIDDCPSAIITVEHEVKIEDAINELEENIQIYPNPATSDLTISLSITGRENLTVELYNVVGQRVYQRIVNGVTGEFSDVINLRDLAKGAYILHIGSSQGTATRKVVVQ